MKWEPPNPSICARVSEGTRCKGGKSVNQCQLHQTENTKTEKVQNANSFAQ